MSIFREWDTRFFDNRVMEGIYFEQDKDRKHYAEVEAKHAEELAYVEKWRAHWEAMYNKASKERDEVWAQAKSDTAEAWSYADRMQKERDEARAEAAHWKPVGVDACWKDHAKSMQKERDEARAELADLKAFVVASSRPALEQTRIEVKYSPSDIEGFTLQRPIARNEYDRRISRLEAKVANLEPGHAR